MAEFQGKPRRRNDLTTPVLFIADFLVALYRFTQDPPAGGQGLEVMAVANSLSATGKFANPFPFETGPTAIIPPLYPHFLALLAWIGRDELRGRMLMVLAVLLAHALHAVLLPKVSLLLFESRVAGIYAAIIFLALPSFEIILAREAIYIATALMSFSLISNRIARSGWPAPLKGATIGAMCGVMILLNPMSLMFCVAWTGYLFFRGALPMKRLVPVATSIFLAAVLVCLPWTIRNRRELGGWMFIRSNFGLELWSAHNPCAVASPVRNIRDGCYAIMHPNLNAAEAARMKEVGEIAYSREKKEAAFAWISSHPERFVRLTLERFVLYWFPYRDTYSPAYGYTVCFITALSIFGLYALFRDGQPAAFLIVIACAMWSPIYYIMQPDMCYRYPILWISLLCAGYAAAGILAPILGRFGPFRLETR